MGIYPSLQQLIQQRYRDLIAQGKSDKDATKEILQISLEALNDLQPLPVQDHKDLI
jgi:hypothetical protein